MHYTLFYDIIHKDGLYHARLYLYDGNTLVKTYLPGANHYYTDRERAVSYAFKRVRHHREDRPIQFLGIYRYPRKNMPVLFMLPKRKRINMSVYNDKPIDTMREKLLEDLQEHIEEINTQSERRYGYCIDGETMIIASIDYGGRMAYKAANLTLSTITRWYNALVSEDKDIIEAFPHEFEYGAW